MIRKFSIVCCLSPTMLPCVDAVAYFESWAESSRLKYAACLVICFDWHTNIYFRNMITADLRKRLPQFWMRFVFSIFLFGSICNWQLTIRNSAAGHRTTYKISCSHKSHIENRCAERICIECVCIVPWASMCTIVHCTHHHVATVGTEIRAHTKKITVSIFIAVRAI